MKKIELYLLAIATIFISSCDLKKEPISAYLHIKPFDVTTQQQITDVWVSDATTGDSLGVYELPATLPIIAEGETKLVVSPGILENGIRATPNMYPMMTQYETTVNLAPNEIDTIQPSTEYDSRVQFHYQADFDGLNTLTEIIDTSIKIETELISASDGAFEGNSVRFVLDEDNPLMEVANEDPLDLETERNQTFMEVHYKTEGILQIGLLAYEPSSTKPVRQLFLALNPKAGWNKVYVNLTDQLVALGPRFTEFRVLFGAQLPNGQTTAKFLIDNVKVMELPDN